MIVGISILQYNTSVAKKQIMQTPQYKSDLAQIRSSSTLQSNNSHANFQRQKWLDGYVNSVDSNFHIPFADLQPVATEEERRSRQNLTKPYEGKAKSRGRRSKAKALRMKKKNEAKRLRQRKKKKKRSMKRTRIDFLKAYYDDLQEDNVFEEIENALEEPGVYVGRIDELVTKSRTTTTLKNST